MTQGAQLPYSMIVLDVDDTLYLERDYVRSGFQHVGLWAATQFGLTGVGELAWSLFEDGVRGSTLTDALEIRGLHVDAGVRSEIVRQYRTHFPDIALLDDAARLISRVTAAGIPMGVVTDGPALSQRNKCRALGCYQWASTVVVTSDMSTSKPDPQVFLEAARGVSGEPETFIYVADNPTKDFQGPLSLGWSVTRVRRIGSLHYGKPTPAKVDEIASLDTMIDRIVSPLNPKAP